MSHRIEEDVCKKKTRDKGRRINNNDEDTLYQCIAFQYKNRNVVCTCGVWVIQAHESDLKRLLGE